MNFHASAKCELAENDDIEKAYAELKKVVEAQIGQEIALWENPQMILRRMQKTGADKYLKDKENEVPF